MNKDIWSTLFLLLVMIAVLLGAYYTTKFISRKSTQSTKNKYFKIIDRIVVSKDKQIIMLEVGDKHFMVGITNQAISLIGTFENGEILKETENEKNSTNKGVVNFITSLVKKAKEDQASLYKARKELRKGTSSKGDILEEMNRSIEQRKNRIRQQADNNDNDSLGTDL